MKKILFLMFTITSMVFSSCSDDDKVTNSLSGTTWIADEEEERFTLILRKIPPHSFMSLMPILMVFMIHRMRKKPP